MPPLTCASILNRRHAVRLAGGGFAVALTAGGVRSSQAEDVSTLEANKILVHRLFAEGFNGGNPAVLAELYGDDVDRGSWARTMPGPAGLPLTADEFRAMFPDVTVAVDAAIAEGDLVATRETWSGAHPPAGRHVMGKTMHVFRIANGQIVEQWSVGWDWINRLSDRRTPKPTNPLLDT